MKKRYYIIIIFVCLNSILNAQTCRFDWPKENLRPDTVTTFIFINTSLKVKTVKDAKATSNFSFKNSLVSLSWIPINTTYIKSFIDRSLNNIEFSKRKKNKILDTLSCNILGKNHVVILFKNGKETLFYIFLIQSGEQDIFVGTIRNKKRVKQTIEYLEANLL